MSCSTGLPGTFVHVMATRLVVGTSGGEGRRHCHSCCRAPELLLALECIGQFCETPAHQHGQRGDGRHPPSAFQNPVPTSVSCGRTLILPRTPVAGSLGSVEFGLCPLLCGEEQGGVALGRPTQLAAGLYEESIKVLGPS